MYVCTRVQLPQRRYQGQCRGGQTMMKDVLIVGQGICGTFLSWYLEQAGLSFVVIDEEQTHTASRAAAGLINPVTGRRIVKTWMIDELLDFAKKAYGEMAPDCMRQVDLIDF